MKQTMFGFILVLVFTFSFANVANAQEVEDGLGDTAVFDTSSYYYPSARGNHSMRKCGITEEVIHRLGYTIPVTLTEPLEIDSVQTCIDGNRKISKYVTELIGKKGKKIVMGPGALIWVNPKDPTFAYAGGCLNGIHVQRVPYNPPVVTVTPTPTPTPSIPVPTPTPITLLCTSTPSQTREMINGKNATITVDDKCNRVVVFDTDIQYQNTCPTVLSAEYGSKGFANRLPSWQEWLLGPGKAVVVAAVTNNGDNRGKAMVQSGIISSIDTVAVNMLFPDYNVLNLQTSAGPMSVQKGKKPFELFIQEFGTIRFEWKKDNNIQMSTARGVCFAGAVQKGVQFASDVLIYRDQKGRVTNIPVKTQTQTPVGQGGLNGGGCIPGANNCPIITSVPTRPTATNPNPVGGTPTVNGNGIPVRPFVNGTLPITGSGATTTTNNQTRPQNGCDSQPGAVCMDVLQRDGSIIRMRVN